MLLGVVVPVFPERVELPTQGLQANLCSAHQVSAGPLAGVSETEALATPPENALFGLATETAWYEVLRPMISDTEVDISTAGNENIRLAAISPAMPPPICASP